MATRRAFACATLARRQTRTMLRHGMQRCALKAKAAGVCALAWVVDEHLLAWQATAPDGSARRSVTFAIPKGDTVFLPRHHRLYEDDRWWTANEYDLEMTVNQRRVQVVIVVPYSC